MSTRGWIEEQIETNPEQAHMLQRVLDYIDMTERRAEQYRQMAQGNATAFLKRIADLEKEITRLNRKLANIGEAQFSSGRVIPPVGGKKVHVIKHESGKL